MAASAGAILRHLQHLAETHEQQSDGQLLERFTGRQEAAAFTALLRRHGRLVWSVCRHILPHEHDAEDAFQATFLILARRAASIRQRESVASWLHGVAYRVAVKAKKMMAKRRHHEHQIAWARSGDRAPTPNVVGARSPDRAPTADLAARELQAMLDEELQRLPEKYRAPFILCCLEGRSRAETAAELGWPEGTVSSRIAQARKLLQVRLARRGVTLSAALTPGAIAGQTVSAALVGPTSQAAMRIAAGQAVGAVVTPRVAALVRAGTRAMAGVKTKIAVAVLLAVSLVSGAGLAVTSRPEERAEPGQTRRKANGSVAAGEVDDEHLPPGAVVRLGSAQLRHPHFVDWALAPDRKTLLTTGQHGDLRSWDVMTGKLLGVRKLPGGPGTSPTLSADGKLLAGHVNQKFVVWDLESGKQLAELSVPNSHPGYFYFSPDGQTLVAQPHTHSAHGILWDWKRDQRREFDLTPKDAKNPMGIRPDSSNHACFSPDGKFLATGVGTQSALCLWNVATAQEVRRFDCDATISVFSPDGEYLAAVSGTYVGGARHNTLHLWEAATGKEAFRLPLEKDDAFYWWAEFSPDGKTIAWVSTEQVTLRDARTGKERLGIPGRQRRVLFSPDGKTLVVQSANRLRLWDLTTGKERNPRPGHDGEADAIAWSADGRRIATASWVEGVLLWDAATGRQLPFPNPANERWEVRNLAFSADGQTLVSAHYDGLLNFWDLARATKKRSVKLVDPDKPNKDWPEFKSYCFTPDQKRLATFDRDFDPVGKEISHLDLWEVETGKHLKRHTLPLSSNWTWTPDGRSAAFTAGDQLLCVEVASGLIRFQVPHTQGGPVAFSPDGKLLAAPLKEGEVRALRVWETATGHEVLTLPTGPITFLALADGRTVLTTDDRALHVWDLALGKELRPYTFPEGCGDLYSRSYGHGLAVSSDGRRAVTSLGDSTLLVWDLTLARQPAGGQPLTAVQVGALWSDLAGKDTAKAYQALWRLTDSPEETVRFVRQRVKPAAVENPQKIRRLIAELDDDAFTVREAAQKALAKLGGAAEPVLREALDGNPSTETRRRIEALLANSASHPADLEAQRCLRAVQVLEQLATAEARQILQDLAGGAAGDRLTREAKAALERLIRR